METETLGRTQTEIITGAAQDAVSVGGGEISIREAMPSSAHSKTMPLRAYYYQPRSLNNKFIYFRQKTTFLERF